MSRQNILGKVSLTPRGEYAPSEQYDALDIVTDNGSAYIVLQSVSGITPPNETYYQVIASKGDSGTDGLSATISAGSVTMLSVGESPTVSNSGTPNSAIFDFGIPYSSIADGSVTLEKLGSDVVAELNSFIDSESFQNAGITGETYVTELNTTTATTSSSTIYPSYVATLVSQEAPDSLQRGYMYRITFDGIQYILPCLEWYVAGTANGTFVSSVFGFVGNISLFEEDNGFYTDVSDVPFLLTSVISTESSVKNEGIFLLTQVIGQHTVKIERIEYTYTGIPYVLIYGSQINPIYRYKANGVSYASYNIGANSLPNKRNSFAIGNCNKVSGNGYMAIGSANTVNAVNAMAVGIRNVASGTGSSAYGVQTNATGSYSQSFGAATTSSGMASQSNGYRTTANHRSQFTFGEFNTPDQSTASASSRGNYVEIVGNGTSVSSTSNARTLDWQGNESLAGGLTLGMGTANEVSITAQQLQQLLALLN